MNNERQGLPSASSMERYMLCPGSYAAERGLPDATSDDAETGNRIHAALMGETVTPPLTDDEERTMQTCKSQAQALLDAYLPHRDQLILERRYWYGEQWSGKPDVVAIDGIFAEGLVIDYKTGRGDVASAEGNMQLRALAVLVAVEHELREVTVAIVQPLAGEASVCVYTLEDLSRATREILAILAAIYQPNAPRKPSPKACKYCKAKGRERCPESIAAVESLPMEISRDGDTLVITPGQMAELLEKLPMIEGIIDSIRAKARRMLEADPQSVPGWTLKPGSPREAITDPTKVFNRFVQLGGTQEAFMPCVKVTKGALKEAVKGVTKTKGKALDEAVEELLEGCTETTTTAPSLVKAETRREIE